VRHHVYLGLSGFSFIQWHYFYFIATTLVASLIFWGSSTPAKSVHYVDSLFLCVSAMTEAGLNTVNLSELNTWQQIMLFLLIIIGSAIFVSSSTLHIRKRAFERKFAELVEQRRKRLHRPRTLTFSLSRRDPVHSDDHGATVASGAFRGRLRDADPACPEAKDPPSSSDSQQNVVVPAETQIEPGTLHATGTTNSDSNAGHIKFQESIPPVEHTGSRPRNIRHSPSFFEGRGVGARGLDNHPRNARPVEFHEEPPDCAIEDDPMQPDPWVKKMHRYVGTVGGYLGRNSQFYHLSEKERRKLGGIEYDAICLLSWLVPAYFTLFQLFGALGVGAWITANRPSTSWTNG
jgi:hypothetical protein